MNTIKSVLLWLGIIFLIVIYIPILWVSKLFDKDPSHYKTGYRFRGLGRAMTRINPWWKVTTHIPYQVKDRNPYIFVANHLSMADIPVLSHVPWEMKWVGKKELFELPLLGKMMVWSKDIYVDRKAANRLIATLKQVKDHIDNKVSVLFFPEGTRSKNGNLNKFNDGAFAMAIRFKVPIIPIVMDGTQKALPKGKWKFDSKVDMHIHVLPPVETSSYKKNEARELSLHVRELMAVKLMELRNASREEVDNVKVLDGNDE
jgi:1-acyl-sn-glycerol-3-phosphate acyltransferase